MQLPSRSGSLLAAARWRPEPALIAPMDDPHDSESTKAMATALRQLESRRDYASAALASANRAVATWTADVATRTAEIAKRTVELEAARKENQRKPKHRPPQQKQAWVEVASEPAEIQSVDPHPPSPPWAVFADDEAPVAAPSDADMESVTPPPRSLPD